MTGSFAIQPFPDPPERMSFQDIRLEFLRIVTGDPSQGLVPYYHFRILNVADSDVGHINFRVGDTEHVQRCVGHIGFEIKDGFRGHGYAFQACCAIAAFVRSIRGSVTMTCDQDNRASIRTIQRLGAVFIDEISVPVHDPHYQSGGRIKRRYRWSP
jgi:predicted acetyltransferase